MYLERGYPVSGVSNSSHEKSCYFETTACLYAKQRCYTLCSPFITWKSCFYFHVWHGDVREVVVLRTAATVEPEGLSSLVACSSYFLSFAIILCWRSFIISNSPASLLIQFLDDFLRSVLVSDFSRVTAFTFFTFRKGFLDLLALLNRNYFVANNQDSLSPLLLPLFLNRLKIRHYFLTLLGVWILRTTQKSYIFQNLAPTFLLQDLTCVPHLLIYSSHFSCLNILCLGFQIWLPSK